MPYTSKRQNQVNHSHERDADGRWLQPSVSSSSASSLVAGGGGGGDSSSFPSPHGLQWNTPFVSSSFTTHQVASGGVGSPVPRGGSSSSSSSSHSSQSPGRNRWLNAPVHRLTYQQPSKERFWSAVRFIRFSVSTTKLVAGGWSSSSSPLLINSHIAFEARKDALNQ